MEQFKENGLYGLKDANGNVVVPAKYNFIDPFFHGFARVKLNGKWGFIDTEYKEVVPPKYDYAWLFYFGFARVRLNESFGLVGEEGKEYFGTPEKEAFLAKLTEWPCWEGLRAFLVEHDGSVEDYFTNHPRGAKDKKWCDEHKRS